MGLYNIPLWMIIACLEAFHSGQLEQDMQIGGIKFHVVLMKKIYSCTLEACSLSISGVVAERS